MSAVIVRNVGEGMRYFVKDGVNHPLTSIRCVDVSEYEWLTEGDNFTVEKATPRRGLYPCPI